MMTENSFIRESERPIVSQNVSILLVEDHSEFRQSIADYLRLRGMRVTEAASGIEFYRALRQARFDVAVLDINLPDTSGFDLAAELSAREDMGIIMLTARKEREDRLRGYGDGAHLYFTKPVDSEELALAIENLARRGRQQVNRAVGNSSSTLRLDRARQTLHDPAGRFVRLSGRELVLLDYLATRPNITVSREEIAGLFGDIEPDPESRALDAALTRLRAKLKAKDVELPLRVIKGVGLRLMANIKVE
ncbi:response regulator transcription factor [Bradyrhizobium sp. Leo170]|uniref:response regulator transcription factor n=2 Tax=unclassified Bradyrhizobium TaxID=2631580 RepID=UPI00102E4B5F|nr:response regulator transcription factor [Bradyrhizobium sp. Leo170]TAI61559.1 hypothetical protein CWO89_34525 [Bradyrhizobium sp. Leo170]